MDYTLIEDTFKSNTLSKFFSRLDDELFCMECTIEEQKAKIKELNGQISEDLDRKLRDGNKMIAHTLMAAIGSPTIDSLTPASATMLATIREMGTIEEVREYISKLQTTQQ